MNLTRLARFLSAPVKKPLKALRDRVRRLTITPLELFPNSPDLFHVYRYLHQHPNVQRKLGGWFYQGGFYPDYLTVGGESYCIFRVALRFCRGDGIDVGAGHWPLPGAICGGCHARARRRKGGFRILQTVHWTTCPVRTAWSTSRTGAKRSANGSGS